ncbi:MAG TPA: 16S rRNA (uracil(1498)-N(3))-methyltransferase [Syntrophomonadaceae bacterium]|nr:16S rRNA (uracil(1498)-N(3))-methyltransferase [Syntrophomonadaceae bacterium]
MHRFYLPNVPCDVSDFPLSRGDAKKILRVLKLEPGDEIWLWDEEGKEYRSEITKTAGMSVFVRVLEECRKDVEPPLRLVLVQGIPKGNKFEFIIQKATELGVWRIYPAVTERTVVRIPSERRESRLRRWQKVAQEAARQCGRVRIPQIMPIIPFVEILRNDDPDAYRMVLWEREAEDNSIKRYLREYQQFTQAPVHLFVGPEGGLSPREVELAKSYGCVTVTLGPRILRTETAGLIGLSLILYEWGDLGG